MGELKKIYIDSRYKSCDSVSNRVFKYEINGSIGIADNTICYIDDISIPRAWYTIEDYIYQLYIETTNSDMTLRKCFDTNYPDGKLHSIWVSSCFKFFIANQIP